MNSNFEGMTALHYAVLEDDVEIVRVLLENGAQVEVSLGTSLTHPCSTPSNTLVSLTHPMPGVQ